MSVTDAKSLALALGFDQGTNPLGPSPGRGNPILQATGPASVSPQMMANPALIAAQQRAQQLSALLMDNRKAGQNLHGGLGEFLPRMLAEYMLSGESRQANTNVAVVTAKRNAAVAAQLAPNDPNKQLLYMTDPENASKAFIDASIKPIDVRQGNTLLNAPGGGSFTAPVYSSEGGQVISYGPGGVTTLGSRAPNYAEQVQQGTLDETKTHDRETEAQGRTGLTIQQQQADSGALSARAAMAGAGAAVQNANTAAAGQPNLGPPAGYVIRGPK